MTKNKIDIRSVEQLIEIITDADGKPQIIRNMILEGDAVDMIACILNKPPASVTWKNVDDVLEALENEGQDKLYDTLFEAVHGVDIPHVPLA